MAATTGIEWTDATWNPVTGCTKISPGCKNCYAERMTLRLKAMGQPRYANGFQVTTHADALTIPLHWRKPRRIFVNSMSDLFHQDVPDEFIDRVFAVMALCRQHTFQVLTKRAERMTEYLTSQTATGYGRHLPILGYHDRLASVRFPLSNVLLGVSVEDQQRADERIPKLLECPAALHFLSAEPLLGELDVSPWLPVDTIGGVEMEPLIRWVIVGAESGPRRRPTETAWIRSLRDQCEAAGTPFLLKQMDVGGKIVKMPLLDGKQWPEVPEVMR